VIFPVASHPVEQEDCHSKVQDPQQQVPGGPQGRSKIYLILRKKYEKEKCLKFFDFVHSSH